MILSDDELEAIWSRTGHGSRQAYARAVALAAAQACARICKRKRRADASLTVGMLSASELERTTLAEAIRKAAGE